MEPVTPLNNAHQAGLFLAVTMHYSKPPLSIDEQITLLKRRGVIISNINDAKMHLTYIGYYRLTGYLKNFSIDTNLYKVNFEQVISLYNFDKNIRMLFIEAIESIEVGIKSVLTVTLSNEYGANWFENEGLYSKPEYLSSFIATIKANIINIPTKKRAAPINHFYEKYNNPKLPPCWMIIESLTMGNVSTLFQSLERSQRKKIAQYFQLDEIILTSWLHSLTYIRNLCAHHMRIWDIKLRIKPKIAHKISHKINNDSDLETLIIILTYLLKIINTNTEWERKIQLVLKTKLDL